MDITSLRQRLQEEGFTHIFEWKDDPGEVYEAHTHKGKVSMYILNGSVTLWFGDEEVRLEEGDRFDVPVGREHRAVVGSHGCRYLVGEMIKGDS